MIMKLGRVARFFGLPMRARAECIRDVLHFLQTDRGFDTAIIEAVKWICHAQDNSAYNDGGVAHHYSLVDGWSSSYPETTGYIIPTMIEYGKRMKDHSVLERSKRMLDWLIQIQFPNGAFQGGLIDSKPIVPVAFNTGQILMGLVAGVEQFGQIYVNAMRRAADWLVNSQDSDGAWRKYSSPFSSAGEKTYDTHVAWSLLEAAKITGDSKYADAAMANVQWALQYQKENGWLDNCCLTDSKQPLTHTLGYALRGILEAYRFTEERYLLKASLRTARGLFNGVREDGFLPGRFNSDWKGTVNWSCLTGSVQVSICWMILYQCTREPWCMNAALSVNRFVRRTMNLGARLGTRGAIKGSFPICGDYCPYEFPNWATKFFIDANLLESELCFH